MEPVAYSRPYPSDAGPLARLEWSTSALQALARSLADAAYRAELERAWKRYGKPIPPGLAELGARP